MPSWRYMEGLSCTSPGWVYLPCGLCLQVLLFFCIGSGRTILVQLSQIATQTVLAVARSLLTIYQLLRVSHAGHKRYQEGLKERQMPLFFFFRENQPGHRPEGEKSHHFGRLRDPANLKATYIW